MEKGDISNEVVPRLVLVFEGLLGLLVDPKAQSRYDKAVKRKRWADAAGAFTINEIVARHVWHVTWHLRYNIDLVTYLNGDEFAEAVRVVIDSENLPISRVYYAKVENFARELSYRPDIARVYDADTHRVFTYGQKGQIISPYQPQFM